MPVVAKLDGVRIMFYANEHPPAHFHVKSAEHQAVMEIATLTVTEGFLPIAVRRKVVAWAATRKKKLELAFIQATSHAKVDDIA